MQAQNGPATGGQRPFVPPTAPSVPPSIGQIIPRLRGAINDIDVFQNMLAQGQGEIIAGMPNWEAVLRQYSLLTARLNALSTHLTTLHSQSPYPGSSRPTPLDTLFVTPLNPLPADTTPLASGTYFEALNTMPLFPLSEHLGSLLSSPSGPWKSMEELRKMDEGDLERLRDRLKDRLRSERETADALSSAIEDAAGEYVWDTRVDEGDDDEDLFGEDEDAEAPKDQDADLDKLPNPREGWALGDYIAFMDNGKRLIL